jgi:hypothetical protein
MSGKAHSTEWGSNGPREMRSDPNSRPPREPNPEIKTVGKSYTAREEQGLTSRGALPGPEKTRVVPSHGRRR